MVYNINGKSCVRACKMTSKKRKIAISSKNSEKSPISWGLRRQTSVCNMHDIHLYCIFKQFNTVKAFFNTGKLGVPLNSTYL